MGRVQIPQPASQGGGRNTRRHVRLFETPWMAACQASLSLTISRSLLKFMSIASVMLSNHLILCHPLLLLPSILERHPQLSLATRGEDWASQGQPKRKPEIPIVTRASRRNSRKTTCQVSMRVARGSASWLSSHGRGLGPQDAGKETMSSPPSSLLSFLLLL